MIRILVIFNFILLLILGIQTHRVNSYKKQYEETKNKLELCKIDYDLCKTKKEKNKQICKQRIKIRHKVQFRIQYLDNLKYQPIIEKKNEGGNETKTNDPILDELNSMFPEN